MWMGPVFIGPGRSPLTQPPGMTVQPARLCHDIRQGVQAKPFGPELFTIWHNFKAFQKQRIGLPRRGHEFPFKGGQDKKEHSRQNG